MSSSNCCFLTCVQISQEAGQAVWYSHLSEFSTVYCDPHSQRLWHSQRLLAYFWNAKAGSQETPGVTGKFGLGVQKEAG